MSEKKKYSTTVYTGTVNGKKQRQHITANSKRELERKKQAIKREVAEGKDLQSSSSFGYWADQWYHEVKAREGLAPQTLAQIRQAIGHLNDQFENFDFKDIHLADFQRFVNTYSSTPAVTTGRVPAKRTILSVVNTYNAVAQYAAESDIPGAKPYKNVAINKDAPVKKRRALTDKEIQWIVETDHPAQIAAMVMIFAGLRRGELVPLQWSDIDLNNGVITVRRFVQMDHNQFIEKDEGKTSKARRRVPIPPVLVEYLKEYRRQGKATSVFVYPKEDGKRHSPSSFRDNWDRYIEALNLKYFYEDRDRWDVIKELNKGVPRWKKQKNGKKVSQWNCTIPLRIEPFTAHYCRHTFATLLFLQDVPPVTAMQYLGHSNIQTTVNIYTDLQQYRFDLDDEFKKKLETEYKVRTA